MKAKIVLPFLILMLFAQCKSSQNSQADNPSVQSTTLLILLKEGVNPKEVASLQSKSILDMKQTSRSQNQWLIKFADPEQAKALLDELKKDDRMIEGGYSDDQSGSNTSTNTKKGKTGPIKN